MIDLFEFYFYEDCPYQDESTSRMATTSKQEI